MKRQLLFTLLLFVGTTVAQAAKPITILSYNVRNGIGMDGKNELSRVTDVINEISPTIASIQELDSVTNRSSKRYILGDISSATGLDCAFSAAIDFSGGKYGVGSLFSEKPISIERVALPGREERRTLLILEFKKYIFCATHLSLTEEDQIESAKIINEIAAKYDKPLFLAGDLNITPDSKPMEILKSKFKILNDAEVWTQPADIPTACIDFILVTKESKVKVISTEVVDEPLASDHRPVVVVVKL